MEGVTNVRGEDLESETQRERELYYVLCTAGVWGVDKRKLARVTSSSIRRAHLHISAEAWAAWKGAGEREGNWERRDRVERARGREGCWEEDVRGGGTHRRPPRSAAP